MVKRLAGSHEVVIHDMNKSEVAKKAPYVEGSPFVNFESGKEYF